MFLHKLFLSAALCSLLTVNALSDTHILTNNQESVMAQGRGFKIVFDEAVVSKENINNPAKEGFLKVTPELKFETAWEAVNTLKVTPLQPIPYRATYTWSLEKNASFLSGKPIPPSIGKTRGKQRLNINVTDLLGYWPSCTATPFIAIAEWDGVPISPETFADAAFETNDNEPPHRVPALISRISFEKAEPYLKNHMKWLFNQIQKDIPKEQWNQPLPSLLVATAKERLTPGRYYELVLKENDQNSYSRGLGKIPVFAASLGYDPSSSAEDDQTRTIYVTFNVPAKISNPEEFLKDNLFISVDGQPTAVSPDGKSRYVEHGNEKVVFSIEPEFLKNRDRSENVGHLPILVKGDAIFECKMEIGDVTSVDGQKLADKGKVFTAALKPRSPELYVDTANNGMISKGNKVIGFQTFNLSALKFTSKKISSSYAFKALDAYETFYEKDREGRAITMKGNRMKLVPVDMLDSDSETFEGQEDCAGKTNLKIPLEKICGENLAPGMYFIEIDGDIAKHVIEGYKRFGMDMGDGEHTEFYGDSASIVAQAVVQLTDIGFLWKSTAKDIFVYAYSLTSGKPLAEGKVEFADKNGKVIGAASLKDGSVLSPLVASTEFIRVSSGNDSYIVRFDDNACQIYLWSYRVDTPDYAFEATNTALEDYEKRLVFTFTDRGLYKPGEEAHIKGVARVLKGNDILPVKDSRILLKLKNPKGDDLWTREATLSEYGTFDLSFKFPQGDVGDYTFVTYFPKDGETKIPDEMADNDDYKTYYKRYLDWENRHYTMDVTVREFKRNAFEVTGVISPVKPGDKKATISTEAVNFTGIPEAGAKVNWTLTTNPTNFYPEHFRDYRFGDHRGYDSEYWETYYGYKSYDYDREEGAEQQAQTDLDDQGKKTWTFTLPEQKDPRALDVYIRSSVTDGNEQTISNTQYDVVYPANVYIGIRGNSHVHSTGKSISLGLVAVDLEGNACTSPVDVEISAFREEFQAVRYMGEDSTTVKNESNVEKVYSGQATISPEDRQSPTNDKIIDVPAEKPGVYTVELRGKDAEGNPFYSATRIWVYGGDYSPWEYQDGLKLSLVPDKQLYQAGDTAKILLQTPIEGDVIVTIEREKVLRSYTRTVTLQNSIVEIPIEDTDAPNVYASVFLVKGADENARELKDPQLKLGYCKLAVQPTLYTLKAKLDAPEESVTPGSKTTITGQITDAAGQPVADAEVTLFVEDEGVLSVNGYKTPSPVNHFFASRELSIVTRTILNRVLSEDAAKRSFDNKGIFVGGGGVLSKKLLSQLTRKDFNPCALWLTGIMTDAAGQFKAEYTNPDTLTRYRVMAVALDKKDRFGSGETKYTVNKPIMLEPAPPFFASEGDELDIPVSVSKTTDRSGKWIVTLESNGIAKVAEASKVIDVPANASVTIPFTVKFTDIGEAKLTWSIRPADENGQALQDEASAKLTDRVEHKFNVEFPAPLLREEHNFSLSSQSNSQDINSLLSKELKSGNASIDLTASNSPMLYSSGNLKFLLGYPHGCLEQKTSKTFPWLYADALSKYLPSFPRYTPERRAEMIQECVNALLSHQASNGALRYWTNDKDFRNSQFAPYAGLALVIAKEQGASVPDSALAKLWGNWKQIKPDNAPFDYYMAYWVMSKAGALTEAELNKVIDDAKSLSKIDAMYLGLAILETDRPNARQLATELVAKGLPRKDAPSWYDSKDDAVEAIYNHKLNEGSDKATASFAKFIMSKSSRRGYTTWQSGWDTLAMGYCLAGTKESDVPLTLQLSVAGTESRVDLPKDGAPERRLFHADENVKVTLQDAGDAAAYFKVLASAKPKSMDFQAVTDKGFTVTRTYMVENEKGDWMPTLEFNVGDIVQVVIEAQKSDYAFEYVVVEDCVPSAFEPIDPTLVSQNAKTPREGYRYNSWVSHTDFLKDKVCFFANTWGRGSSFRASYLARVTKSGKVIAPPVKVELMYEPQIYGLSLNQPLIIKPKK